MVTCTVQYSGPDLASGQNAEARFDFLISDF
jgi:hypothetical protein